MMEYKYVTNNNLENTQDYMYSQYLGQDFLKQYFESRYAYAQAGTTNAHAAMDELLNICTSSSESFQALKNLYYQINRCEAELPIQLIRLFQKRFEIKKRLYDSYRTNTSIASSSKKYNDLNLYLLLSAILLETYQKTYSLTYLSTFLKINDTLISCGDAMTVEQKQLLKALIWEELKLVKMIIKEKWNL